MAQQLKLKHKGLQTSPNEFSEVSEGSLYKADNCILTVDGVLEPRRGNLRLANTSDGNDRISRIDVFQDQTMVNYSNGKIGYVNGSSITALSGSFDHPNSTNARTRFLNSSNNLYFTSDEGVLRLDTYNGTPISAGIPKGLDIDLAATGSSGSLDDQNQYAYRMLWGFTDANGTVHLGAPSGRGILILNIGGSVTRNATVTFSIPDGITTSYFYQVYRSAASGGVSVEPDDELQLIYESNPSSSDITNGYVTFTDITTDDLRGATIYTAPSQFTLSQANDTPPIANDIEEFESCICYANTTSKHRKTFTILAVGGSAGIQTDDTITIAGTTYTAKSSETISSGFYKLTTSGTPAQNISDTARSLVKVINRYASNTTVSAYYLSSQNDLPGQILIEERGLGGASFAITASANGSAFNPTLPTSGTSISSSNDDFQNAIMFSRSGIGEAVPLLNLKRVGSANFAITRIKKLRRSLFIFKEGEGIYRMTGSDPNNFSVELFDNSAKLIAPDSVAIVNNQIWCLTDQGITTVSETGVSVVSRPIEDLILEEFGSALAQVKQYSHGVGYETERQYLLFIPSASSDTTATQVLVFNIFTKSFTKWNVSANTGFVSPVDDKLYLGDANSNYILQERKSRTYTDYVDHAVTYTLSSSSGTSVFLTDTTEIQVGDVLFQSSSKNSLILAVEPAFITVKDEVSWTAGSVSVLKGYQIDLEYTAVFGTNPGTSKQFSEVSWFFKVPRFNAIQSKFATDISPGYTSVEIVGDRSGLWGLFPWGQVPWGGTSSPQPIRVYVPLEKSRGSLIRIGFRIREGYSNWKLNGASLWFRDTGSRAISK